MVVNFPNNRSNCDGEHNLLYPVVWAIEIEREKLTSYPAVLIIAPIVTAIQAKPLKQTKKMIPLNRLLFEVFLYKMFTRKCGNSSADNPLTREGF